jgi:hypothetical protein
MRAYDPINVLKPVASDVWVVDGPIIRMSMLGLSVPFPTRMTIVRLAGGDLFIHSPTELTRELKAEIDAIGTPRHLVGPSWLHHSWMPEWKHAFPDARAFVADGVPKRARQRFDFETERLASARGYPWDDSIHTLPAKGRLGTEVIFFHEDSRSLVLTDFIENFEPGMIDSPWVRFLTRIGGVQHPHGGMPRDMRLTYPREALRRIVETMLAWNPQRIILAHGRWYQENAVAELRRAFHWVLERGP